MIQFIIFLPVICTHLSPSWPIPASPSVVIFPCSATWRSLPSLVTVSLTQSQEESRSCWASRRWPREVHCPHLTPVSSAFSSFPFDMRTSHPCLSRQRSAHHSVPPWPPLSPSLSRLTHQRDSSVASSRCDFILW